MVTTVRTEDAAKRLAVEINSVRRPKPYVVVSTPAGRSRPYIDPAEVESQVGNLAAVFLPGGPDRLSRPDVLPSAGRVLGKHDCHVVGQTTTRVLVQVGQQLLERLVGVT